VGGLDARDDPGWAERGDARDEISWASRQAGSPAHVGRRPEAAQVGLDSRHLPRDVSHPQRDRGRRKGVRGPILVPSLAKKIVRYHKREGWRLWFRPRTFDPGSHLRVGSIRLGRWPEAVTKMHLS